MKNLLKRSLFFLYSILSKVFYPKCPWIKDWDPLAIRGYIFWQKIININNARHIPWPVHFTSRVGGNITVGKMTAPGYAPGSYINGLNGIEFGDNVWIGPGVKIISANHDLSDYKRHTYAERMKIGDNVWLGANSILLPGIEIGAHTVVGAGSVVTKSLPKNVVAVGNPAKVIRKKTTNLDSM